MREYIKKIQAKSEETRKQILIGSLIVLMSFVGIIWLSSFKYKFSNSESSVVKLEEEKAVEPFDLFGQIAEDTYTNITASAGNVSNNNEKIIKEEGNQIDLIPVSNE